MSISIERRKFIFKIKEVWFADTPYDIEGCDVLIFIATKTKVDIEGFSQKESDTWVIDLTQNPSNIWEDMQASCRYKINRAKREGVRILVNQGLEEFSKINRSFRKAKGLPRSSERVEFMEKYATLFVAEFNGQILGGQLYLEDANNIRLLIGASRRLEVDKEEATLIANANRLLIWETINYAKKKGIRIFDFGGYYTGEIKDEQKEKINIFKQSFGGRLMTYYIYQREYSGIYRVLKRLYRLIKNQDG